MKRFWTFEVKRQPILIQIEKLSGIGMQLTSTTGNQDDDNDDHDEGGESEDGGDGDVDRGPG